MQDPHGVMLVYYLSSSVFMPGKLVLCYTTTGYSWANQLWNVRKWCWFTGSRHIYVTNTHSQYATPPHVGQLGNIMTSYRAIWIHCFRENWSYSVPVVSAQTGASSSAHTTPPSGTEQYGQISTNTQQSSPAQWLSRSGFLGYVPSQCWFHG
jgi:hypothetical protein